MLFVQNACPLLKKIQNRITCLSLSSYGIASITWGLLCFLPFQDTDANFKYWMGSTLQFKSELFWEGTPPNLQIFFSCRLAHVQSLCINKHILSQEDRNPTVPKLRKIPSYFAAGLRVETEECFVVIQKINNSIRCKLCTYIYYRMWASQRHRYRR